ncbi:hypothetical protein APB26_32490 [Pseudomonas aeruginosa]|uniref:hypothetical protein n=1 Tax=Pseudomonas aeruginosa TaxID=287 RepID=UPI00071BD473|nr:hypothetical protein [Pseudomonas aeruginosa]KSQ21701.1 hypothetical protein APB26_32490 [Pseudomonas aeruginosa]RPV61373.1 hypothetical protein IPC838_18820 [Pseudomonas aeruginosa]
MHFNRDILCCTNAHAAARLILAGKRLPSSLEAYREGARYLLAAIDAGWFVLPHWAESGAYSREQFHGMTARLQCHPDIPSATQLATSAVKHAQEAFQGPLFELIGSSRNNRLPDPVAMAKCAAYACPRMPLEFVAGKFTTSEYCDLLEDVSGVCQHVEVLSSILTRPGMLDPDACLAAKIDHLRHIGRPGWIPAIVRSVHFGFLSLEAIAVLRNVTAGTVDGGEFVAFVEKDQRQREEHNRMAWQGRKAMIGRVAGVLADSRTYHQAALTKHLRRELGSCFGVVNQSGRLMVNTDSYLELGATAQARTGFELVNWVLALDNALRHQPDSHEGYWLACDEATAALERMRADAA